MQLRYRNVSIDDSSTLLEWRNDFEVRKFSFNKSLISNKEHEIWFMNRLNYLDKEPFWIFEEFEELVGMVRFDKSYEESKFEISILVNEFYRNKGYGKRILDISIKKFLLLYPKAKIIAKIHLQNTPSLKLFRQTGFINLETRDSYQILEFCTTFD